MKIKNRLLLLLVPAIVIALCLLTLFSYRSASNQAKNTAVAQARAIALEQSARIFDSIQRAETAVNTFAPIALDFKQNGIDRELLTLALRGVAASSPEFYGVWLLWEANAYDGQDSRYVDDLDVGNAEGRTNAFWFWEEGELVYEPSDDYNKEFYYNLPLDTKRLTIIPPYRDMDTEDHVLMTTVTMPIVENGRSLGVLGIDIELEYLSALIREVQPYESGYAMLISDSGAILGDPIDREPIIINGEEQLPQVDPAVLTKMHSGTEFSFPAESLINGEAVQCYYTPVSLDSSSKPWYFMAALPEAKVMEASTNALILQLTISLCALIILVFIVFYAAGKVAKPLQLTAAYAQEVAGGNRPAAPSGPAFAKEIEDLRAALASMLDSLLHTMGEAENRSEEAQREAERARIAVKDAELARERAETARQSMMEVAGRVDAVSQKLQHTSAELTGTISSASQETQEQDGLMLETVDAVNGMTDSIQQVARTAADAAEFAERARARASEGAQSVDSTLAAFESIRRETDALGTQIEDLGVRTEGIGSILTMINDIADQTNLLALNAAIEAARAGEYGRGFAVVADEVRKLAEKTVQATRQVEEAVNGIRTSMRESAQSVTRTSETVHTTVELGQGAQASLADIVELVSGMNDQVHAIAGLCQDQAATSGQVTAVVDRLRDLSLNVSDAMTRSAAITNTLEPEAKELGLLVEQLNKDE